MAVFRDFFGRVSLTATKIYLTINSVVNPENTPTNQPDTPKTNNLIGYMGKTLRHQNPAKKVLLLVGLIGGLSSLALIICLVIIKPGSKQAGIFQKQSAQASGYPARGVKGDLIADIVIGQRDITEVSILEVSNNALSEPGGVVLDHGLKKTYVWDSGNNRVVS